MWKKGAAAENSISMYHVLQEIQKGLRNLCFQEAYNCRGRPNAEQSIRRSTFGFPWWWQKKTEHVSRKRYIGEQAVTKEAGYSGDKLGVESSSFIFTHKYNEKLLETLRRWHMIQEMDREENFEGSAVPLSTGDRMEENGHLGIQIREKEYISDIKTY